MVSHISSGQKDINTLTYRVAKLETRQTGLQSEKNSAYRRGIRCVDVFLEVGRSESPHRSVFAEKKITILKLYLKMGGDFRYSR